jgi:hypothetical protein
MATLDVTAPRLTILSPTGTALTRERLVDVTGTVVDASAVTVTIGSRSMTTSNGQFAFAGVPLTEGENRLTVHATDAANRTSTSQVIVTLDTTPPTVAVSSPERITRRLPGQAVADVSDLNDVAQVVLRFGADAPQVLSGGPFTLPLTVPANATVGETLVLTVTATDRAGNVATASRGVRIGADGSIVGQVLSDANGLPLAGATVVLDQTTRTTDAQGRYTLPTSASSAVLTVSRDGMTSVVRSTSIAADTGTVPVDARLTPLAVPTPVGAAGGVVSAAVTGGPTYRLDVPAGATGATAVTLTPLSPQGLPDLLPLGWSPLAALDLRSSSPVGGALPLTITLPASVSAAFSATPALRPAALVEYRSLLHAWVVVARELVPTTAHEIGVNLPRTGAFALVTADVQTPALETPAVDEALSGVPAVLLPFTTTTRGEVSPAVLPPAGGTAEGRLAVYSTTALPSGTLVQAEIEETFTLPSGQVASEELRRADVILYRAPAVPIAVGDGTAAPADQPPIFAAFPIAPSRSFEASNLVEGRVHLDILAGREGARGTTGGRDTVTSTDGDARLIVPGGALAEDTAIRVTQSPLSAFLPSVAGLTALGEVVVDLSGQTLIADAELSFGGSIAAAGGAAGAGAFVLARVDRLDGVPYLTAVSFVESAAGRLVPQASTDLPGVRQGGRYVLYHVSGGVGRIRGVVQAAGQGASAFVATDTLPFVVRSNSGDGAYSVLALAGTVTATARVPHTALQTQGTVTVLANDAATLALTLAAQVTTAVVAPADGARAVPRHTQFAVTASAPLDRLQLGSAAISLALVPASGPNVPVAVRMVLAGSGRTLSIVPATPLAADSTYRLDVGGLLDTYGAIVAVPTVTVHTLAEAAPTYSPDSLTASFPDAQGRVTLSAPAGSFPSGTQFLVINASSGEVISFTAVNDGSVSARINATINDRLVLTITDTDGRVTTQARSQYVDAATGQTAVGSGGGVVTGAGGVEVRVPEGAVSQGVRLKVSAVPESEFPVKPGIPDTHFGGGLRMDSPDRPTFAKEVDLAFPVPQAAIDATAAAGRSPGDAFYYVLRRVDGPNGEVLYQTVDYAKVEGTGSDARVVTASFPFPGVTFGVEQSYFILMWSFNHLVPGSSAAGVITGTVQKVDPLTLTATPAGKGLWVTAVDPSGNSLDEVGVTIVGAVGSYTDAFSRYVVFDWHFTAGQVSMQTTVDGQAYRGAVFTVPRTPPPSDPGLLELLINTKFPAVGNANINIPLPPPATAPPAITLRVMTQTEGARRDIGGLVVEGTPLVIGASAAGATEGLTLTVNDQPVAVRRDPARDSVTPDPLAMDVVTAADFVPPAPGTYTVTARLQNGSIPISRNSTFRVLAAGGGLTTDPDAAPAILDARTLPRPGATGIPINTVVQLAFSEPVRGIPGRVTLVGPNGNVEVALSGVGRDSEGHEVPLSAIGAADVVTSITIQPRAALAFGRQYRVAVAEGIVDLDSTPKTLAPYESRFTTFQPGVVPSPPSGPLPTSFFSAPGLVAFDDRAYVVASAYTGGLDTASMEGAVRTYDLSDPSDPRELLPRGWVGAAPRDIAGEARCPNGSVTCASGLKKRTLAVTTMPRALPVNGGVVSGPGTLLVYDASTVTPTFTGAVTLTDNLEDGVPTRVIIRDDIAYVSTWRKGLQVVNLQAAKTSGPVARLGEAERGATLFAPGAGAVNSSSVIATIPVVDPVAPHPPTLLLDLEVGEYQVEGQPTRLIVATGSNDWSGLVIADPARPEPLLVERLTHGGVTLVRGEAVALGRVGGRDLAVIGGWGNATGTNAAAGATGVIMIVDLSPLASSPRGEPTILSAHAVDHAVGDVLIQGDVVAVSSISRDITQSVPETTTLVSITDPLAPVNVGKVDGVGGRLATAFGGGLLVSGNGLLLASQKRPALQTATLQRLAIVRYHDPVFSRLRRGANEATWVSLTEARPVATVFPSDTTVSAATLSVTMPGGVPSTMPLTRTDEGWTTTIAAGRELSKGASLGLTATLMTPDGPLTSFPRAIDFGGIELIVDVNNDTHVDDRDEELRYRDPNAALAFWEHEFYEKEPHQRLLDFTGLRLLVTASWTNRPVRLRMDAPLPAGSQWTVMERMGDDLDYLSKEATGSRQLALMATPCDAGNVGGLCTTENGAHLTLPAGILTRTRDFLFRCDSCGETFGSDERKFVLAVDTPTGPVTLDEVKLDIRKFQHWVSAYTARQPRTDRPRHVLEAVNGWAPLPADRTSVEGITLVVHGFAVSHDGALNSFIPQAAKRLYWAGHPILEGQPNRHHVVGLTWPGSVTPADALIPAPQVYFPEDEFRALEMQVPLANFLGTTLAGFRGINVLAHSLGNMAVNSALAVLPANTVKNYAMVDAAVPNEAFGTSYTPSITETVALQTAPGGAIANGYPTDGLYIADWTMLIGRALVGDVLPYVSWAANVNLWRGYDPDRSTEELGRLYMERWRTAENESSPWRGLFAMNPSRTRMLNFHNPFDMVLSIDKVFPIWLSCQLLQKPQLAGGLGVAHYDDSNTQLWGRLSFVDAEEEALFTGSPGNPNVYSPARAQLRRWSELAFWFQPLSGAAGQMPIRNQLVTNHDMTLVGGDGNLPGVTSHTYMTSLPAWKTRSMYVRIVDYFKPTSPGAPPSP